MLVFGLIFTVLTGVIYFLPTLVARFHRHPSVLAIFAVNLFFGGTLLGWMIAFLWALARPASAVRPRPIRRTVTQWDQRPAIQRPAGRSRPALTKKWLMASAVVLYAGI